MRCIIVAADACTRAQLCWIVQSFGFETICINKPQDLVPFTHRAPEALIIVYDESETTQRIIAFEQAWPSTHRPPASLLLPPDLCIDEESMLALFLESGKFDVVPDEQELLVAAE